MPLGLIGIVPTVYTAFGVNLKTTGLTTILPAQAKRFYFIGAAVVQRTRTGTGTMPSATVGTNSSDYDNLVNGTEVILTFGNFAGAVDQLVPATLTDADNYIAYADLTSNGLRLNLTVASTLTTHTADFFVFGAVI